MMAFPRFMKMLGDRAGDVSVEIKKATKTANKKPVMLANFRGAVEKPVIMLRACAMRLSVV